VSLFSDPAFYTAIAGLAWPLVFFLVAMAFRRPILNLLQGETVKIKVAGMEISVAQAAEQAGRGLSELVERVAELEKAAEDGQGPKPFRDTTGAPIPMPKLEGGAVPAGDDPFAAPPDAKTIPPRANYVAGPRPARLVWVDDNPANNAFLIDRLSQEGWATELAPGTREGLEMLEHGPIDMLITDLGRTEGERHNARAGVDLLRQVAERRPSLPVVVYTSARGASLEAELRDLGASLVTHSAVELIKFATRHHPARGA